MASAPPPPAFTTATVVHAVLTLYAPETGEAERRQADSYLQSFQADNGAWQIGHELLTAAAPPGVGSEAQLGQVRFFAAQTMHTKFKFDFAQLPIELHTSMRDVALGYVPLFKDACAPLRPQIALVVAALTVQLAQWQQPIQQLISQFANDQTALILLDVLCELPEECRAERTVISSEGRRVARGKLREASSHVLQLLNSYLQVAGSNPALQNQVLRCLALWAEYDFPAADLAATPLLALTFQALQNPDLVGTARDCICQFLFNSRNMEASAPLVNVLLPNILQLGPLYAKYVADEDEDEVEGARALCHVISDMAWNYMPWMLRASPEALQALQLVLQCSTHTNTKVARYALDFWLDFGEAIRDLSEQQFAAVKVALAPTARELLRIITTQVRPVDETLDEEPREEKRRFRHACGDCTLDCVAVILGGSETLGAVMQLLQSSFQQYQQNPASWEGIEAALYCVRSIARSIPADEQIYLPQLMSFLCQLPADLHAVRYTATLIVGRYAFWLSSRPDMLVPLLQYVVQGLNHKSTQPAAALAINHISRDCSDFILAQPALLENLWTLYASTAVGGALPPIEQQEILMAMTRLVWHMPAGDVQMAALGRVLTPILTQLSAHSTLCTSGAMHTAAQQAESAKYAREALDRMALFLEKSDYSGATVAAGSHPLVSVLTQCWPLLQGLFEVFRGDESAIEKLQRLFKFAIRGLGAQFEPLLPQLMQAIVHYFPLTQFSCLLFLAGLIVRNFAHLPTMAQPLGMLLVALSQPSLTMLNSQQALAERCDIVEDYFGLVGDYLLHCPHLLTQAQLVDPVFQCGLLGLRLQHREAFPKVVTAVRLLVWSALPTPSRHLLDREDEKSTAAHGMPARAPADTVVFQQAVMQHAASLVGVLVDCYAGAVQNPQIKFVHQVFEVLRELPDNAWFHLAEPALKAHAGADAGAKQALMGELTRADGRYSTRLEAAIEFWQHCRNRSGPRR